MTWKLYIDSRKKIPNARKNSHSDFAIQLPYPINVSGKAFIDVVLFTNSFYTIRANENDRLFIDELAAQTKRLVILAPGQYNVYTLKDELVSALNASKLIVGQYRVTYNVTTNRYDIDIVTPDALDVFRIWTENYIPDHLASWNTAFPVIDSVIRSANHVCGFVSGSTLDGTNVTKITGNDAPDMQPYKQLFIRSNLGGGSSESLGVNSETDIIRRIVIANTPFNGMVHDVHAQQLDSVAINNNTELTQLWFQLIDVNGTTVDTHGHPISFSIIFQNVDE
jgi:hypothetical protein